jgi:glutathionylspermidine synthase
MKRLVFKPRPNYKETNENLGFDYHTTEDKDYWLETVGYQFTSQEVDRLEKATNELHQMCFNAIDYVIKKNKFDLFDIPAKMIPYIKKSWQREDWSMYGRFDFFFDGTKIKVFEYNADTPTSLLEAALIQWEWKEGQKLPDQFNSIDDKLVAWWKSYKEEKKVNKVYFTTIKENTEDFRNTEYLMDTATRAGIETDFIFIEDIGSDGEYLYDLNDQVIDHLFKLYPWEWLAKEEFIDAILNDKCTLIEPVWKMLLSNKALMAILWELYPNHEYLLPTYFTPDKFSGSYVKKPLLSREGQNVEIITPKKTTRQAGLYGSDKNIYQAVCELPTFDGVHPVIGSWVVGEESAGISIREDSTLVTANMSRFVPHFFGEIQSSYRATSSLKKASPADENPFQSTRDRARKDNQDLLGKLLRISLVVVGAVILGIMVNNHNETVDAENKVTNRYNMDQQQVLDQIFNPIARGENLRWIQSHIDPKNQEVFKMFILTTPKLIQAGVEKKMEEFKALDQGLMKAVYCIQGDKDIDLFEDFSANHIMETEAEKQVLVAIKKQFNYYDTKIDVPKENDLIEICDFKDFEKDFTELNKQLQSKGIVTEDAED